MNFVFKTIVQTYNLLYTKKHFVDLKPNFVYFYYRYPKADDYLLITQALLKALNIPIADINATVRK